MVAIALFGGAALAWLVYFQSKQDRWREGIALKLAALAGGASSVVLAFGGFGGFDRLGLPIEWDALVEAPWRRAVGSALAIGGVEETAKLLSALPAALWARRFGRRLDGILYAACVGIGFATAESVSLWMQGELPLADGMARAAAAPLTHALFATPWGLGLWAAIRHRRWWALPVGWLISVLGHAGYDLMVARPSLPNVLSALLVLAIWIWFLRTAPQLRRVQPA